MVLVLVGADRRASVVSNAPSEMSRSDIATRGGKGKIDGSHIREQPKNYYKVVYENKEVNKLLQMLGTSISSTKGVGVLHLVTLPYKRQELSLNDGF